MAIRPSTYLLRTVTAALLLAAGFVLGTGFRREPAPPRSQPPPVATPRPAAVRSDLTAGEKATIALFRKASPSVVFISTLAVERDFFTRNVYEIPQGTGSGFIWDRQGHVVTNFHVIQGGNAVRVTLADQSTWDADLVGAAAEKDLAVLIIKAPGDRLPPIEVGASYDLSVGQDVLAIGNPFGLDQSLTTGVISALGREIKSPSGFPIRDVIQTDAAINPGNSGGPLLDSSGRLIGVNAAIYSPSGAYAGIGFAIPVDTVNWVVPELITHGQLVRPSLGAQVAPDNIAQQLGVDGALVVSVDRGSGAARAGLRPTRRNALGRLVLGDTIVSVDGQPVHSADDLLLLLEKHKAGDTLHLGLRRNGQTVDVGVVLGPSRQNNS